MQHHPGPMKEICVRKYTKEVLQGLRYLHRRKIMHRDIKGQNVLVDTDGNIKLTDFGASKQIHTVALSAMEGAS
jgi:mitogen-activated protein kinase kinase kinase ANP1